MIKGYALALLLLPRNSADRGAARPGMLGTGFALFESAATGGNGLLGGFGTMMRMSAGWLADPFQEGINNGG